MTLINHSLVNSTTFSVFIEKAVNTTWNHLACHSLNLEELA
jgi:hypothetical protein